GSRPSPFSADAGSVAHVWGWWFAIVKLELPQPMQFAITPPAIHSVPVNLLTSRAESPVPSDPSWLRICRLENPQSFTREARGLAGGPAAALARLHTQILVLLRDARD